MRRSHETIRELIAARVQDFVELNASEAVTRASLKAIGADQDEINRLIEIALRVIHKRLETVKDYEAARMNASVVYIADYLGRKK